MRRCRKAEKDVFPRKPAVVKAKLHRDPMVPAGPPLERHVGQGTPAVVPEARKGEIGKLSRDRWHYVVQWA